MFFTESARLARKHPDLAGVVEAIDDRLSSMGDAEVLRTDDLASALRADPNQVSSVLEMLARDGLLRAEEMVECAYCRIVMPRTMFEEIRDEEGEVACTSCDRPLTDRTEDTITTFRRGIKWRGSELSPNLAAAVVASLSLRDLHRIRALYPSAIHDGDAREFHEALIAHLSAALEDEDLRDLRDSIYREMKFDGPDLDPELTVLLTALVLRCPDVHIAGAGEEATRKAMDQAVVACRENVPSSLKAIVDQLIEIKVVDCRIPEGDDPAYADPRRSLQLLQAYWSLARAIVLNQMSTHVGLQPHPLLRLVMNLRARMETYFGRLSEHEGALDVLATGDRLLDMAVGGDPDDLSAAPDWTHQEVQTVDSFLERVRLKVGSKAFPLTHEEKVFLEHAEAAIQDYQKQANAAWQRVLENTTQQPASPPAEAGGSTQQSPSDYCRVMRRGGSGTLTKSDYEHLVQSKGDYGMFIDGITREASCRDGDGALRTATLTARELGILTDVITAGRQMRPHSTKTGSGCASRKAAARLFEEARRKADVKVGRYEYRAFRLCRSPSGPASTAYEFAPPDDLQYCVILPV